MLLSWKQVLERDDLVGGDIETQEQVPRSGYLVYRGPIKEIKEVNDEIQVHTEWVALLTEEGWVELDDGAPYFVAVAHTQHVRDLGQGRLAFNIPDIGFAVIYPKGGSKLDRGQVKRDLQEQPKAMVVNPPRQQ